MSPYSPPEDPDLAATTNLLQLVTTGADRFGADPYLLPAEGEGRVVSFADVLTFTKGCAALLDEHGVSPGARVAVILHNSSLAALLFIGIIAAQRTLVPLNPKTSPAEVEAVLDHAKPELVIGHQGQLAATAGRNLRWITVDDAETMLAGILARGAAYQGELSVSNDDRSDDDRSDDHRSDDHRSDDDGLLDAEIVYTSGSTGTPKGVVLSHRSLLANSLAMVRWADAGQDDVFLNVVPMFHAGAQGFPTLTPLWCGGRTVCARSDIALVRFWRYVDRHQPTWTLVVNAYLASLAERPERPTSRSLKAVLAGGSALGTELIHRFEDTFGIPVRQVYGMTEMTSLTTVEERDRDPGGVRTAGPPVPFAKVRIVDPDGKDLPAGADGEILLSGPSIFTRYEGEQELTAGKLVDGWVRSGDLGHLDEHGRLSVVDRIDSMVIVSGENVYPAEIENLVPRLAGIQDAVVVAVPNAVTGAELVLVHTLLPGAPTDHDAWRATLMEHLGGFKVPRRFVALDEIGVDTFPRTPVGKIKRSEVQRLAVDRLA